MRVSVGTTEPFGSFLVLTGISLLRSPRCYLHPVNVDVCTQRSSCETLLFTIEGYLLRAALAAWPA